MQNELISELGSPVRDIIFHLQWRRNAPLKVFRAVYKTFSAILETLQD